MPGRKIIRGGPRAGAGRPKGATKRKLSITVDEENLKLALARWDGGKASSLFNSLLQDFVKDSSSSKGG